jgi:hypothetical protein
VLSYSHKEKVLNDFSDAKKAHRWKAEIAEKPTDAKESIPMTTRGNIPDAKLYKRSVKMKDKKITHRNGFQKGSRQI